MSFDIRRGEHVAILGKVGSGKSTLIKLLVGLYQPNEGDVCLDGVDIKQLDPADLRRHIGYAEQSPSLFHGTLRENITLGEPQVDDNAVVAAALMAGLREMVDGHPHGLQLPVGERGQGLSGGQKQAIANARVFLCSSPVVVLDEPTSSMDHGAEQHFLASMQKLTTDRTLILVTHKPTMLALVSRIIVIDGGKIVADGPRDDVLQRLSGGNTK